MVFGKVSHSRVPEGEKDGGREGRMKGGIEGGREEQEMYLKK